MDHFTGTSNITQNNYHHLIRKTLQFLVPLSIFSVFVSYFSGFSFLFFSHNLHFSTLILPLFDQAPDRKYMFLICNGILALLAKNLKLSSSGVNYGGQFVKNAEDCLEQISAFPEEAAAQENTASIGYISDSPLDVPVSDEKQTTSEQERDYVDSPTINVAVPEEEHEQDRGGFSQGAEEIIKTGDMILESDAWEEDEDEDEEEDDDDDDDDDEIEESRGPESTSLIDASVSTEELNKRFEEFIRKMKEEIRIEARQHLIAV